MTNHPFKSGPSRGQLSFLPPSIEDYVGRENVVRAIDAFVCGLDVEKLGFRHAGRSEGVGQPPYHPADLLKLHIYGYLNQVRSSRRLACEAGRNLEVIWLLKGLQPGYRTIATFRKDNWAAFKAANREFVLLARALDLVSGELAALDRDIEAYGRALETNDSAETRASSGEDRGDDRRDGGGASERMTALMEQRAELQA